MGERIRKIGQKNERRIVRKHRKQGYQVLITHKVGFPDMIVLKDKEIRFFVEVKTGRHQVHPHQEGTHKDLQEMGFQVIIERLKRRSLSS